MGAGEIKILTHHQSHQGILPLEFKLQQKIYDGAKLSPRGRPPQLKTRATHRSINRGVVKENWYFQSMSYFTAISDNIGKG